MFRAVFFLSLFIFATFLLDFHIGIEHALCINFGLVWKGAVQRGEMGGGGFKITLIYFKRHSRHFLWCNHSLYLRCVHPFVSHQSLAPLAPLFVAFNQHTPAYTCEPIVNIKTILDSRCCICEHIWPGLYRMCTLLKAVFVVNAGSTGFTAFQIACSDGFCAVLSIQENGHFLRALMAKFTLRNPSDIFANQNFSLVSHQNCGSLHQSIELSLIFLVGQFSDLRK